LRADACRIHTLLQVNNTHRGEHPFHLHGHDLWIVDSSGEPDGEALYGPNFVRRDVVSVSAGGWARMRFVADNPGIWVHHCACPRDVCRCPAAHADMRTISVLHPSIRRPYRLAYAQRLAPVARPCDHACALLTSILLPGMMVTIIEAPSELQRRAAAGELVTSSPSHLRACEAPQTLLSVVRSAAMHKHHGGR
jgi:hypothetical protein